MIQIGLQPSLRPDDIRQLVALARAVTGITLSESKTDFLMGRLGRRLAARGLTSYADYCRLLTNDATERVAFGEALTTHTTSFFREKAQYDWLLAEGLPELDGSGRLKGRDLVIWSAACSTGQEGYSALMVAHQARDRGMRTINPRLIGTDISRPVVGHARQAVYSRAETDGIPPALRPRFLLSSKTANDVHRIVPELREQSSWRTANLLTGEGLDGIAADVVFLRNVLIYFDAEIRGRVIDAVYRRLRTGGFLMTGHTEASHARRDGLELVRPSIYRKIAP
ncbi:protein-glutamate O-methyltransferase CheR [uncultured Jannaschia sp.]|uniref:CheR family methyltransferase n=1 Tax=uncultured Jannaschia sp. TaxID=293347 RepID=UPI002624ECF4|nr:protein-glutamate O-methyltransferase CheR [uncultured Jannaschia sp.]